jgi:hypothetical protein
MTVGPHPPQIRRLVVRTFRDLGVAAQDLFQLDETLLVQDDRCVARSYRAGGLLAMWLIPAGLLQFYDGDGQMLRTLNLLHELQPQRKAA